MRKFELTTDTKMHFGRKLFRIKALISFGNVKVGDMGGYIEKEENLSQYGDAWVSGNAKVFGNAEVFGDAWVSGNAKVFGNAWVSGNAKVSGDAWVYGDAKVSGNAEVFGNALVSGNAEVFGNALVYGDAKVSGNAEVFGNALVSGNADYATASGFGSEYRTTTFFKLKNSDEIGVRCGCFYGTLKEFKERVKETHGETKKAKEYLMLADLMEYRFSEEKKA